MKSCNPKITEAEILRRCDKPICREVCHLVNLDKLISSSFDAAIANLSNDGFSCYYKDCSSENDSQAIEKLPDNIENMSPDDIVKAYMLKFNHRLNRGYVYSKPDEGNCNIFIHSGRIILISEAFATVFTALIIPILFLHFI